MPLVYIILVNYNGYKDTLECVKSLRKVTYENYKVVIVDNASKDASVKILKKELMDCCVLESKENLGFAGGNNLGIKYALDSGADYVLLLNNDTLVEENFLTSMMVSFKEDKKIGVVGCKIMYHPESNIIWYGGGYIDWFKFLGMHYGIREIDKGQYDKEKKVDFVTGCCMLIKKEVLEKVGLLPEDYFMYLEDLDFCVKVKNYGYKIWYSPKAVIYHKVGFSSGGEDSAFTIEWITRNRLLFMNRYKNKVPSFKFVLSKLIFYLTRAVRYIQFLIKGREDKAQAILAGIKSKG